MDTVPLGVLFLSSLSLRSPLCKMWAVCLSRIRRGRGVSVLRARPCLLVVAPPGVRPQVRQSREDTGTPEDIKRIFIESTPSPCTRKWSKVSSHSKSLLTISQEQKARREHRDSPSLDLSLDFHFDGALRQLLGHVDFINARTTDNPQRDVSMNHTSFAPRV